MLRMQPESRTSDHRLICLRVARDHLQQRSLNSCPRRPSPLLQLFRFLKLISPQSAAPLLKAGCRTAYYNNLPIVSTLIAHGKESIPYLISKLDDDTKIEGHVIDYWSEVRVGDVALVILTDFFTDGSWQHTTIPGVSWDEFWSEEATPISLVSKF